MSTKGDTWAHHDNMITNLKDWVSREMVRLRADVAKHAPEMEEDPSTMKLYRSMDEAKDSLFSLMRCISDAAEKASKKKQKSAETRENTTTEVVG
jgi:hypothetical protein